MTNPVGDGARSHDGSDVVDDRRGRQQARLYERLHCESVCPSADLTDCEFCETEVDRFPAEHDPGFGSGEAGDG